MATTIDEIKSTYPVPVYYYQVHVGTIGDMNFSEVSGLAIEYDTISYKDGMSFKMGEKHMPGQMKAVNVTLKKGIVRADSKLFNWVSTVALNTVQKEDIAISLIDESDQPVVKWTVYNAFPKKLDAPGFNAGSNEVAIESMELMADRLDVEYL